MTVKAADAPAAGDGAVRRRRADRSARLRARKSVAARRPCAAAVPAGHWPGRTAGRSRMAAAGSTWRGRSRRPRIRSPAGSSSTGSGCTILASRWSRPPATSAPAARRPPIPSCSTTWPRGFSEEGWSLKALHRRDHALEHLPAGELRPARVPPGRPGKPAALAVSAAPARPRGDARHALVRFGPARFQDGGPAGGRGRRPENGRRTVYGMVDRQSLPAVFRAFDFASPDQSAERRPRTTVPQQALFSMNAPFVIEQAKALAARPDVAAGADDRGADRRALPRGPGAASGPGRDPGGRAVPRTGRSKTERRVAAIRQLVPLGAARPGACS